MTTPATWTLTPAGRRHLAKQERECERHQKLLSARSLAKQRRRWLAAGRKPRKRVRQRSAAGAAREKELKRVIAEKMKDPANHRCSIRKEGVCTGATEQWDHEIPRSIRPDLITDPRNIRPTCFMCHNYIGDHPAEAYEKGWLKKGNEL